MTLALLFPGQGTQHPAMLSWLDHQPEAADLLAQMAARVGADWRARLADPAWANANRIAQPLLTGLGLAAWRCLSPRLPAPSVIAGYSVGELPAFGAAGVIDAGTAIELAQARAEAMARSVAGLDTGLLAVTGAGEPAVAQACRQHGLAVAIELAADRWVLGGPATALDAAAASPALAGALCTRLAVALASHTPWMRDAVEAFAQRLATVPLGRPQARLVCNLTGAAVQREHDLRAALAGQLAAPVRWSRVLDAIAERRPRCVLEVGPGSTLCKLWNAAHPGVPARSADDFRSPQAVADWANGVLAAQ